MAVSLTGLPGELDQQRNVRCRGTVRTFRQVVLLVDVDGLTYEETADVLGSPTGTVMSRLHRARRRLRKHLQHAGVTPSGTVR
jgi:hypothetical protein